MKGGGRLCILLLLTCRALYFMDFWAKSRCSWSRFGHAAAVASVSALGRLGQSFALFSRMTPLLIEPYFAKLPAHRVKRNYLGLFAVEALLCGA
jgi:hypothetical protein